MIVVLFHGKREVLVVQNQSIEMESLTARDLLAQIYAAFAALPGAKSVAFERLVFSTIARDLDDRGCAYYQHALAVTLGRTNWVLSLGTAEDSYLANPFGSDIAAFPLGISVDVASEESIARVTANKLSHTELFRHSILLSMANGSIGMNERDGVFQTGTFFILHSIDARSYISTVYERLGPYLLYRPPRFSPDGTPCYRPEFVPYLARAFQRMLEKDNRGL
jgi:hypothetical protein